MKTVLVVSVCEKINKKHFGVWNYQFHFKGYFCGKRIDLVIVESLLEKNISIGEEYILYLETLNVNGKILETKLLKFKPIKNICNAL